MKNLTEAYVNTKQKIFIDNLDLVSGDPAEDGGADFGLVSIDISIKHDLARSCFQLWPKIGDEGDKISRKKTGEALAETVFFRNFVTLGADFESQN